MFSGTLVLVGGNEWGEGTTFDQQLLEISGAQTVHILPTAQAFENPKKAIENARRWFSSLGANIEPINVLSRSDANEEIYADTLRDAKFIYLSGGSALHLKTALKNTPVYTAIIDAYRNGAVVAASSAAAMVLGDPMVDPRGGAFTTGLGLLKNFAAVPHFGRQSKERYDRTIKFAPPYVTLAAISEKTALIRDPDGIWHKDGLGEVHLIKESVEIDLTTFSLDPEAQTLVDS